MKILCLLLLLIPSLAFAQFQQQSQQQPYNKVYILSATTTPVKYGSGILHTIVVNGGTAGTIIVYNSLTGSGDIISSFDSTNALATYTYDIGFSSGCTVVTSAATKITVNYL